MTDSVRSELTKFIGKEVLIDLVGKDFAPKGFLKEVKQDFIILGETRIVISAIAGFKLSGGYR